MLSLYIFFISLFNGLFFILICDGKTAGNNLIIIF
jgi:hypothetical protein